MSTATEKLKKELGIVTAGDRKVQAMKEPIYTALCSFCEQDEEFEQAVLQGGTMSDCLKYVAKGGGGLNLGPGSVQEGGAVLLSRSNRGDDAYCQHGG